MRAVEFQPVEAGKAARRAAATKSALIRAVIGAGRFARPLRNAVQVLPRTRGDKRPIVRRKRLVLATAHATPVEPFAPE